MKKFVATILFILSFMPAVVFADTATSTLPSAADIQTAKNQFTLELLKDFTPKQVSKIILNPNLKLDTVVVQKGVTGAGFNYFSQEFGLITTSTIKTGLNFRSKNWKYLKRAYETYGTESYYILGILRLETYFGAYNPKRLAANSLYSIYVLDPTRRNFALREFKTLFKLSQKNGFDLFSVRGSVAGAYGLPQFIPSSVTKFAVDGNFDKKIDMFNNADAIMSVGNYLKMNGWGSSDAQKQSAVYAYNHDQGYVDAVMAYGNAIKQIIEGK